MDPIKNPYAPGAGTPPPELAGRGDVIKAGKVALGRVREGKPSQSLILVGLRGVGKTVLLNKLDEIAEDLGYKTTVIEAHEGKSLPELIVPSIRSMIISLSKVSNAKEKALKALRIMRSFVTGLKVTINDVDLAISMDAEAGVADSGNIEVDLPELFVSLGEASKAANKPVAIFIDELQYINPKEFSALIMSVHKINQRELPIILVGAGLPQILGLAGNSKSYAERLFRYPEIGALAHDDAVRAIVAPARAEDVAFDDGAVELILRMTDRYPYFLQQWAYEAWNLAPTRDITVQVVQEASDLAIKELDQSFFKVRFDRCTPSEKKYMRALAEFGSGKHRSGDVAEKLGVKVTSVAPTRSSLIKKGMIYSPAHGDTAFTVPLFDQYMRRAMPNRE